MARCSIEQNTVPPQAELRLAELDFWYAMHAYEYRGYRCSRHTLSRTIRRTRTCSWDKVVQLEEVRLYQCNKAQLQNEFSSTESNSWFWCCSVKLTSDWITQAWAAASTSAGSGTAESFSGRRHHQHQTTSQRIQWCSCHCAIQTSGMRLLWQDTLFFWANEWNLTALE